MIVSAETPRQEWLFWLLFEHVTISCICVSVNLHIPGNTMHSYVFVSRYMINIDIVSKCHCMCRTNLLAKYTHILIMSLAQPRSVKK